VWVLKDRPNLNWWVVATSFVLVLAALSGCQALARPTALPTPTPILLAPEAKPREVPTAAPTAVPTAVPIVAATLVAGATEPVPAPTPAVAAPVVAATLPLAQDRLMALGKRLTLALRAEPRADAAVVVQVPGAQALWAEGRSADDRWLWVTYGEKGDHGWLPAADASLFGETAGLPVVQQVAAAPTAPASSADKSGAAGRAPASAARQPGKLAFQTAIGGDIYVVNADGTGLRRVTDGMDPILSPDGTQLAFARWGSPDGVFVLDLRTGEERRIATVNRPRSPAWSPDGNQLAFERVTRSTACRATPFGCMTDAELRARFGGKDCIDTPFGTFCIGDFPMSQVDQIGITRVGADGQGWQDIVSETDAQSLAWYPRRDEFLFRSAGGLQIIAPDGVPQPLVNNADMASPAISPDGQRIAVQMHLHDHKDIFLLDAAGQIIQRLTTPPYGGGHAPDNVAPAWSPDGKTILFLTNRDGGTWRLYRMNPDGSDQAPFLPAVLKEIPFRYDFAADRVVSWGK
jgi:Tol biopolymer transport system component